MTLKKLLLTFNIVIFYLLSTVVLKAELINPNSSIKPKQVIEIQLLGLMKNDNFFEDSGIQQTWNFAHPENKKNTGPLPNFIQMIKSRSYQMLINHISHTARSISTSVKTFDLIRSTIARHS